jgi:hypothetical protein
LAQPSVRLLSNEAHIWCCSTNNIDDRELDDYEDLMSDEERQPDNRMDPLASARGS